MHPRRNVQVISPQALSFFVSCSKLTIRIANDRGANGNTVEAKITAVRASHTGTSTFLVVSELGERRTFWVGVVGN